MAKLLVILTFLILLIPSVQAQSLQLELVINNTSHDVYIPGQGESPSSGLSQSVYSTPPNFYIASYLSGLMVALASGYGQSLSTDSGSGYHVIGLEQDLGEPAFLAFTSGDWQVAESRIGDIETGDFLDYISPSFSYGLGDYHPLMVALHYSGIDIDGSLGSTKGIYKLVIENKGQSAGRPVVEVTG